MVGNPKVSFFDSQIRSSAPLKHVSRVPSPEWWGPASLTGTLQVQRKVPADVLGPQGHIPPSLLHRGRKDELNLGDEELGPG